MKIVQEVQVLQPYHGPSGSAPRSGFPVVSRDDRGPLIKLLESQGIGVNRIKSTQTVNYSPERSLPIEVEFPKEREVIKYDLRGATKEGIPIQIRIHNYEQPPHNHRSYGGSSLIGGPVSVTQGIEFLVFVGDEKEDNHGQKRTMMAIYDSLTEGITAFYQAKDTFVKGIEKSVRESLNRPKQKLPTIPNRRRKT